MFILDARLSTWLAGLAFVAVALLRRDTRLIAAGWTWLAGYEAAFQVTAVAVGSPARIQGWIAYLAIAFGAFTVGWFSFHGIRPSRPGVLTVAAIWAIWLAIGFPANLHTMVGFDPAAEVFNEGTKTALALAYLWPLARTPKWLLSSG